MLFRKKFSFLIVLAVFFLIFAAGCDSGSNTHSDQAVVTTVETEGEFSGSLESLNSDETIEILADLGTDTSDFELKRVSGNYSIIGTDENSLKTISGNLKIGNGSTIDVELANLNLKGTLTVDIGTGDLNLNNVTAQNLEIKSAGSKSVHINENSVIAEIKITGQSVRLVVNTENEIGRLELAAGADDAVIEGTKAKIKNAVVNAERAKFKGFRPEKVEGNKTPDYIDVDDNTPTDTISWETGNVNFYLSNQQSLNAIQAVNIANKPEKTGKPNDKEITEVNVVIERIEFHKQDGSGWQEWEAFSGPQQVNLLSENLMEEFKVEGEAEAGEFDSVRLYAAAEYDENLEEDENTVDEDNVENDEDTATTQAVISFQNTDSTSSEDSISIDDSTTTEDSITTEDSVTTEDPIDEDSEENDFEGKSYLVYADGSTEELWVHAASKAGIKIKGDFTVEAGTTTDLNINFDAGDLINMRGPKVAPMLLPRAFKMQAEQTKGALSVEIENFAEVGVAELTLKDKEENEYMPQQVEGEEGLFLFSQLDAGEYELSLSAEGYQLVEETVTVVVGEQVEKIYTLTELESGDDSTVDEPENIEESTENTQPEA